jgi:hypothetical protein
MNRRPEPEIIPPGAPWPRPVPTSGMLSDASLDRLASLLDDGFSVPGTSLRFGLDPLIGLIPGIGDLLGGLASFVFVFAGWQRRLPQVTLLRMVVNIAIDSLGGTLPVIGDAFDVYWKSNRMNFQLLQRHALAPHRNHAWRDWLFLWMVIVIMVALALLPVAILVWIIYLLRR